ncbi:MAG: hypothetical protein ACRD37_10690 [Candidatus Acidiferrales bacterium]
MKFGVAKQPWTYEDGVMDLEIFSLPDVAAIVTIESIGTPNRK